jgi:hypothetical protein
MRRIILLFLFAMSSTDYCQNTVIKSLQVYSGNDELSLPVVASSKELKQSLTIEFDVESADRPGLEIEFRFCDINWNSYYDQALINQGHNTIKAEPLEKISIINAGAGYHYKGTFPQADITFPFAGKWSFCIKDPLRTYTEGYFYVVQQLTPVYAQLSKEVLKTAVSNKLELNHTYNLKTTFDLPDSLQPANVIGVEVVENRKMFNPEQIIEKKSGLKKYYFDGKNKFTYITRSIHPGNGYRHLDLRDISKYTYPDTDAKFDTIETSEFYNFREHDLVGGALITNFKDESSQYLNVRFRLFSRGSHARKIFVTGAFTNWRVLPEYEMKRDRGIYTVDIPIKRGEYDYQYVLGDIEGQKVINIDWFTLEGNFWETDNDYHIFVYYFVPENGGYNKIIGYKKIRSGGL